MPFFKKQKEQTAAGEDRLIFRVFGATLGSVALFFIEVLQILVIAAVIIIVTRYFLVKPFLVLGASMEPNFYNNEYLIIDELSYRLRDISRGEVVVFAPPTSPSQFYIKRVIGLPGETVSIKDGTITISNTEYPNGFTLKEDYIEEYTHGREEIILGEDEYYVLGDNRDESLDSRSFGSIKENTIVGRAWVRGFPLDRLGFIASPNYSYIY
ncbi:MAG: signal peptidase I [Patescibacteria group bacterium]|jgi:signal peptidase I